MATIPPDAFILIIGAMKSGTSTLYSLLAQHPQICECKVKEPGFFLERNQVNEQPNLTQVYSALWDFDVETHKYAIEGSTGYSKYPFERYVPRRISEYGLSPRLIYLVRDPLQRIESQYNFTVGTWWFDPSVAITDERYVALSRYHTQLEQFRRYFSKEHITIVDFDELIQAPRRMADKLCRALDIQPYEPSVQNVHRNKTEMPSETYLALKQAYLRIVKQLPSVRSLAKILPRQARRGLTRQLERGLEKSRVLSQKRSKRILDDREREIIRRKLTDDMLKFEHEYAIPVAKWGFRATSPELC